MWLAPLAEETNGIVIGYVVHVTGQDTDEVVELQTNATSAQVENLHPFYSYVFTVAARTEAGAGPFSPVVYLQMPTAGLSTNNYFLGTITVSLFCLFQPPLVLSAM